MRVKAKFGPRAKVWQPCSISLFISLTRLEVCKAVQPCSCLDTRVCSVSVLSKLNFTAELQNSTSSWTAKPACQNVVLCLNTSKERSFINDFFFANLNAPFERAWARVWTRSLWRLRTASRTPFTSVAGVQYNSQLRNRKLPVCRSYNYVTISGHSVLVHMAETRRRREPSDLADRFKECSGKVSTQQHPHGKNLTFLLNFVRLFWSSNSVVSLCVCYFVCLFLPLSYFTTTLSSHATDLTKKETCTFKIVLWGTAL